MNRYELLEWHDRRYQHVKDVQGTEDQARRFIKRLNEGYTGPRFILKGEKGVLA